MRAKQLAVSVAAALTLSVTAQAQTTVTIGTVNNGDMIIMQRLSSQFEEQNPDIDLDWVVLEENVLRQRLTTDIATGSGQFDVSTIGTYEVPIWAEQGWLEPLDDLPADYDVEDILASVRDGLSHDGTLYALPFYAESSMLFYRTDLFEQAGITVPEQPSWEQVRDFAAQLHDPDNGVYGICLRGKPGWGENMGLVSTMVNTYGGRWFDMDWNPTIDSPAWKAAITDYVELLNNYGPPGATSNGFNENLSLFATGKCAMWVDATVAAGLLFNPDESQVADRVGFAQAPIAETPKGANWLWSWALAIPATSDAKDAATQFIAWATSKDYIQLVGEQVGWTSVPAGTRISTYENPNYTEAAPFAEPVLKAIQTADPTDQTLEPSPYTGIQYVGIPEFQAIGTQVGQTIAAALSGQMSVDQALQSAQASVSRTMRQAGYTQ
ncbi:MAG: sugar ABC transporter substrate-binding protein [Candidatus Competibacterales bacterium]|nr:sugar ABC transporter substrate-binding protein [Candidatus Competibacterales bacterium]